MRKIRVFTEKMDLIHLHRENPWRGLNQTSVRRLRLTFRAHAAAAARPVPSNNIAVGSGFSETVGVEGLTIPTLGPWWIAVLNPPCFPLLFSKLAANRYAVSVT